MKRHVRVPASPTGRCDWSPGADIARKLSYVDTDIRCADAGAFDTNGSTFGPEIAGGAVVVSLTASF